MESWIEVAQRTCPDPVVAASLFKPNASGSWELASLAALSERQLLKGAGTYFAERVLLAVTTLEVVVIDAGASGVIRHRQRSWRRDELIVTVVANREGRVPLPAVLLGRRYDLARVELAPRAADSRTVSVLERLVSWGLVAHERE
jgi:hypothetical protein